MSVAIRMCPQCGSPGVDYSTLANGAAQCKGCRWQGKVEDLLVVPGSAEVNDQTSLTNMLNDVRKLLSGELGLPYLRFLTKWGFLQGDVANAVNTIDRKAFARYLAAIAGAIMAAVIMERARAEAARIAKKVGPN
jgi:hypothetical protein